MKFNLKKVIASVAALAMSLSCFTAFAADFSDVEATASYKNAIDTLVALKVVNGYEDGTFKPEAEITRAEVTKMVVAAMGPSYTAAAESSVGASEFADVKGHWAAGYISVGVAQKFINGMGDGTFAPDANVTYAQIVKMLVAALGYESAANIAGGYPNGYLQTGNQIGVTAGVAGVSADTNVTRAQVAQLIANAVDVPLVVVTNWTTNILTGDPVAETEIMDGTEGKKYQTLLTEYHDTYKVKGRVTDTHAMGNGVEVGMVQFDVEYADNFDGDYVDEKKYPGTTVSVDAYVGDTAAEDLLFTYAEALIAIDADDEAHIISIFPYGKNDVFTFSADDITATGTPGAETVTNYAAPVASGSGAADGSIAFYTTAGSSKTKSYVIAKDAKFYVNGVKVPAVTYDEVTDNVDYNGDGDTADVYTIYPFDPANINDYIVNNKIGTVTLIDAPAAGSTSKDGKIDVITVDVAKWAVVETAMLEGDEIAIYLKDFEMGFVDTPIVIDLEEEDLIYSITKDGVDIEYTDLKEDDILLVKYNVVANAGSASASNFIDIIVSDKVVEGQVTGVKTVDDIKVYTIAGEEYKLAVSGTLTAGNEYKAYLDAAGRIVKFDETTSSANYAIVDRVYKDNNTDEYMIRLIKADGTREAYVAKDQATAEDAAYIAYAAADDDGTLETNEYDHTGTTATLDALEARLVTYKTNANGEVREIFLIDDLTVTPVSGDYVENTKKVGTVRMSEATQILDLVDFIAGGSTSSADINVGSLSTFIDGEAYTVIAGDKSTSDNTFRFVVVTAGNAKITATTTFAVIDNISTGIADDGSQIEVINAYVADETGVTALNVDEDASVKNMSNSTITLNNTNFPHGSVVVLGYNAEGAVAEVRGPIYTANNSAAAVSSMWSASKANDKTGGSASTYFLTTGITAWDGSDVSDNNWARAGFGIVLDKIGQSVVMATVNGSNTSVENVDTEEFSVASDVNVYVYDYAKKNGARISKGSFGNVTKTFVSESAITQDGSGRDVYNWASVTRTPTYAFYKVTNDDITDIIVIKPAV